MAKRKKETQKTSVSSSKATALLGTDRAVIPNRGEASRLWNKGAFGELSRGALQLSFLEAYHLQGTGRLKVKQGGKAVSKKKMLSLCLKKYDMFLPKFSAYADMRSRGYIVKTGFKFGTHFRLYPRGSRPGTGHADFLLHVLPEEKFFKLETTELSRTVRLSQSVRKKVWYAVVDEEGGITYYEIVRIKP